MGKNGSPETRSASKQKEQRRHRRVDLSVQGEFDGSPCEIRDISRSGMRCSKGDEHEVGTVAEISFTLPEEYGQLFQHAEEHKIGLNTRVRWCRKDRTGKYIIGVEVLQIPEATQEQFFTYLYHGLLKSVPILRGVSDEVIRSLAGKVTAVAYRPGDVIVEEEAPGTYLYVVSSGSVEVVKELTAGEWTHISNLGVGQSFGEMSLLTGERTSARVVAAEHCEILMLHRDDFSDLLVGFPELYRHFISMLADRLRHTTVDVLEERNKEIVLRRLLAEQRRDSAQVLIGSSRAMKELRAALEKPVDAELCVLIEGETGVGKELIAHILHERSSRAGRPFIVVDGQQFAEDEWGERLFGSRPSAGLTHLPRCYGYFELAEGGTLLLKNIELMSPQIQARLREMLDAKQAAKQAEVISGVPDVMVMATCREELGPKVERGEVDAGLAERLSKRRVVVPPLRARKRDIPELVEHFVATHSKRLQKHIQRVHRDVMQQLLAYDYPLGNVQELEECIERAIILADGEEIGLEHLFLRALREHGGLSYNLLRTSNLRRLLKLRLWPTAVQVSTVLIFTAIFVLLFAKSAGKEHWGLVLVWSVWWPLLFISFLLVGRIWCAACPIGAFTQVIQRFKHLNKSVPAPLKRYDYALMTVGFLLIMWVEEVSGMRHSGLATGLLLLFILAGAAIFNTLYERATWCRHLCPLGGLAGLCGMTSLAEVRPNIDVCSHQCTTHSCYKGTEDVAGCPLFQHVMFVNTNQHCKMCLNCLRSCPNDAVQLNLRLPAQEIWIAPQTTKTGFYIFAAVLLGIFFPVYIHEMQGVEAFGGSVALFTLAFVVAAAAAVGFFRLTGWLLPSGEGFLVRNLWRQAVYAYLPLVVGVYTAYQFRLIEQLETYHLRLFPVAGGAFIFQWPAFYPFVMLFVGVGLLLSFLCLDRMLHYVQALSTTQRRALRSVHMIAQVAYGAAALALMLGR